jgi:outer membrane receptor protein involved in Fe transport
MMFYVPSQRPQRHRSAASGVFIGLLLASAAAQADDQPPPEEVVITARHLNEARDSIQTNLGASLYALTDQAIQNQPGGADIPLNQTLLQAPGVSQDSYGQIHLRNDHANIQYRIDGAILPEGISFFGQSLASRFASSINLITGSLPAQYGLATSGIVDIQTKSGSFKQGGSVGIYGGSNGWIEPSAEYAGSSGGFNYYVSGDFTRNTIGIENPTATTSPIHDLTQQAHGFALLEDIIDEDTKVSAILGYYQGSFQIPDSPGQTPLYHYGSQTAFNSAQLNEHQLESNDYGVVTFLKAKEDYDFQISAFERYGRLGYTPDAIGDLMFYGLTQTAVRQDISEGLQLDATYRATPAHTLRMGGLFTAERALSSTDSEVFPCLTADCSSVATLKVSVAANGGKTGMTYSAYVQDEWSLTPDVTLNYGLRYDILNGYTNTDQLSPRVNMVWKPDADTALHAGYSRYFTPPSLEQISGQSLSQFANSTGYPAGYTAAAPPQDGVILPERSNYYDVGAERTILPGLKLGIDGYIKVAKDLIDEGQFGAPIILSVFNYAHGDVYGAEFTSSYEQDNWSLYNNFSFGRQRATQIVSQQFNFTPADLAFIAKNFIYTDHSQWYTVSGGVSYNLMGTHLNADLVYGTGLRQSVNGIPNGSTVAPYAQINLGANHRFEELFGAPVEVGLNVINVTDRDYILRSGSGVGVFAPQYGPRRAVYSSLRVFF